MRSLFLLATATTTFAQTDTPSFMPTYSPTVDPTMDTTADYVWTTNDYGWNNTWDNTWDDSDNMTFVWGDAIACGDSVTGTLDDNTVVILNFTNVYEQDVFFTNCNSSFDTHMDLYYGNASHLFKVTNYSTNGCDGDDCDYRYWCGNSLRESFMIRDVPAGDFWLFLHGVSGGGDYNVEIYCETDDYNNSLFDMTSTDQPWMYSTDWDYDNTTKCAYHAECPWYSPFCYEGECNSCDECHYCSDGIDGTCGYCGIYYDTNTSYPLYEDANCTAYNDSIIVTMDTISCGERYEGYVNDSNHVVYLSFYIDEDQDVFFTNCNSTFDTQMSLMSTDNWNLQNQSWNQCDGDDCNYMGYCDAYGRESFYMEDLEAGNYTIGMKPFWEGGYVVIEVFCESDGSLNNSMFNPTTTWDWDYSTTADNRTSCSSHDDCSSSSPFCYNGYCDSCAECHYCWDGIDNTCGYCGIIYNTNYSFPLYENNTNCSEEVYTTTPDWDDVDCDLFINGSCYQMTTISCGETVTGTLEHYEILVLNITTDEEQDIFFSNCGSDFDTTMILWDGNYSELQLDASNGGCYGDDDCDNYCYCDDGIHESWLIEDVPADEYWLELAPYSGSGDYMVWMSCETDTDFEVVDKCGDTFSNYSVECGETVSGTMGAYDTVIVEFEIDVNQSVLFSSCASDFATNMSVFSYDQGTITGPCGDCNYMGYCDVEDRSTIYFDNLYAFEVGNWSWQYEVEITAVNEDGGDWSLVVECSTDSDWSDNVDSLTTEAPTTESDSGSSEGTPSPVEATAGPTTSTEEPNGSSASALSVIVSLLMGAVVKLMM